METKKTLQEEIRKELHEWSSSLTAHGFPNIARSERTFVKVSWIIFLIVSFGLCSFMIAQSISAYLSFEVVSQVRVFNEVPMEFPTVTICNLNPFVTDKAVQLFEKLGFSKPQFRREAFKPSFGDDNRKLLSPDLNELIFYCAFNNGKNCQKINQEYAEFTWIYRIDWGNCLRFNSGKNRTNHTVPIKKIFKEGAYSSLYLEIFLPERERIREYLYKRGIRIFLENSSNLHSVYSDGIDIKPGTFTEISMKKKIIDRLPYPYSNCQNEFPSEWPESEILKEKGILYREKDCSYICMQKEIIKTCSCYDLWYENFDASLEPCMNKTQTDCANNIFDKVYQFGHSEDCLSVCLPECYSVVYETSLTAADYPPRNYYEESLKEKPIIKDLFGREQIKNYSFELLKERVISLKIYFNDLYYTKFSEKEKVNLVDLIANIGGTLGLFLGVSVLSFVEVFELMVNCVHICFRHKKIAKNEILPES